MKGEISEVQLANFKINSLFYAVPTMLIEKSEHVL